MTQHQSLTRTLVLASTSAALIALALPVAAQDANANAAPAATEAPATPAPAADPNAPKAAEAASEAPSAQAPANADTQTTAPALTSAADVVAKGKVGDAVRLEGKLTRKIDAEHFEFSDGKASVKLKIASKVIPKAKITNATPLRVTGTVQNPVSYTHLGAG